MKGTYIGLYWRVCTTNIRIQPFTEFLVQVDTFNIHSVEVSLLFYQSFPQRALTESLLLIVVCITLIIMTNAHWSSKAAGITSRLYQCEWRVFSISLTLMKVSVLSPYSRPQLIWLWLRDSMPYTTETWKVKAASNELSYPLIAL